ncbi:MAG: rod shape-determining protein MreC [Alphaproteobacteria bacterium]
MRRRSLLKKSLSPLGNWGQWFFFALLLAVSLGLIVLTRLDSTSLSSARAIAIDFVSPVLDGLTKPVIAAQKVGEDVKSYGALKEEVTALRKDKQELENWKARAEVLKSENTKLRELVSLVDDEPYGFLTVRVVSDQGSSYTKSMLVNAGSDHGLRVGMGATIASRLAGRVIDVGKRASRVLLLTDLTSRIPVIVENTGAEAVLSGNNSPTLDLLHLSPAAQAEVKEGDRLITSGAGGVFPYGLLAGRVVRVNQSGVIAKPVVDWDRALFIQVVDYNICHFMVEDNDCPF